MRRPAGRHLPGLRCRRHAGQEVLRRLRRPPAPAPGGDGRFAAPSGYTPRHLAEQILKDRSTLQGERKQVTVLFADVSGFTSIAERLDPEEVHGLTCRASWPR